MMPTYPDLAGKIAVVTGGSRGIGAATGQALAANGAGVAIVGRDETAIGATVEDIEKAGGRAIGVRTDVTVEAEVGHLAQVVSEQLGPVDIVAAFAGGAGMPVPTAQESATHWREVIDSELTSTFLTISAFLLGMIERRRGTIVTMSSSAGRQASQSSAAYAAGKAGVIALTRHLANEVGHHGVRVNCLSPSTVVNDKLRAWVSEEDRAAMGATYPLGRLGQPEDVAGAAVFLASSASSWITGVTLDVAGGKVMV
jgi:3-oxoacyl-[acyl-carrier protein] reductase